MTQITLIGLDIAKHVFHVVGLHERREVVLRRKLGRSQIHKFFSQLDSTTIVLEACGSAHFWAREFQTLSHQAILLPPQHVKAYLRGQKNDFNDALAIAEAYLHGAIRPAAIKSEAQQDRQSLHRIRSLVIAERVALGNQMRGFLYERGIILKQGISVIQRDIPVLLNANNDCLSPRGKALLTRLYNRFLMLSDEIETLTKEIEKEVKQDRDAIRLMTIPGIGPIVSSALLGWIGDGQQFKKGRDASAALGLVPRQNSSGGKNRLFGITKRGDSYLRALVVHGARAVMLRADNKSDALSQWAIRLKERRGHNRAIVALANKIIRIAWAILTRKDIYHPHALEANS